LDFQRRFHPRQFAHLLLGLSQVPCAPLPLRILKRYVSIHGKRSDTPHARVVPTSCAPLPYHRHIVKAPVGDPGNRLAGFERRESLTYGFQGFLHFRRLTHKPGGLAAKESVIEDAASSWRDSQYV
jgi:hypothetical protein